GHSRWREPGSDRRRRQRPSVPPRRRGGRSGGGALGPVEPRARPEAGGGRPGARARPLQRRLDGGGHGPSVRVSGMRTGVAFVIGSFRFGGAERDLLELARRLDPRRYALHVLFQERDGELLADMEATGASLERLPIENLTSMAGLRAVAR